MTDMVGRLGGEVQQRRAMPIREEAYGNLLRTAAILLTEEARILEPLDMTPTQHNILRILRGARPGGLRVGAIMERLVSPSPDATRLVDRLERKGLVSRRADPADGRAVRIHIGREGLEVLLRADRALRAMLDRVLGSIPRSRLEGLIGELERIRAGAEGGRA